MIRQEIERYWPCVGTRVFQIGTNTRAKGLDVLCSKMQRSWPLIKTIIIVDLCEFLQQLLQTVGTLVWYKLVWLFPNTYLTWLLILILPLHCNSCNIDVYPEALVNYCPEWESFTYWSSFSQQDEGKWCGGDQFCPRGLVMNVGLS